MRRAVRYLNELSTLTARFIQISSNGAYAEGEMMVQRLRQSGVELTSTEMEALREVSHRSLRMFALPRRYRRIHTEAVSRGQ